MRTILLIENSPSQSQVIRQDLENQNYNVLVATGAFEAQLALAGQTPDLIVLDSLLPDSDGIELCRNLKRSTRSLNVPVIVYSADTRLQNMRKAYEAGADYYLVKDQESKQALRVLADSIFTRRYRPRLSLSA